MSSTTIQHVIIKYSNNITTMINDTTTWTDARTTIHNDIANIGVDITTTVNSNRFKHTVNNTSLTGTNNDGTSTIDESIAINSSTTTSTNNVDVTNAKRDNETTSTNTYINHRTSQAAPVDNTKEADQCPIR